MHWVPWEGKFRRTWKWWRNSGLKRGRTMSYPKSKLKKNVLAVEKNLASVVIRVWNLLRSRPSSASSAAAAHIWHQQRSSKSKGFPPISPMRPREKGRTITVITAASEQRHRTSSSRQMCLVFVQLSRVVVEVLNPWVSHHPWRKTSPVGPAGAYHISPANLIHWRRSSVLFAFRGTLISALAFIHFELVAAELVRLGESDKFGWKYDQGTL